MAIASVAACGRLGYDPQASMVVDAPADAPMCTADMTPIAVDARVCIELTERGTVPWTEARDTCASLGRRLCADLEWYTGCVNATGLVDMIDLGYEWVAEETGGVALKRGADACTVMSSHVVTDPYEYRCCADL